MRGLECNSLRVNLSLDWASLEADHSTEVVETHEVSVISEFEPVVVCIGIHNGKLSLLDS